MQQAESMINEWLAKPNIYSVGVETDADGSVEVVGRQLKALPTDLGLVVGDALQALRSSLDNLAYALTLKNTPGLTGKQEKNISFPISDTPPTMGDERIKYMSDAARTILIGLSPDKRVSPLNENPLWLLNKANNRDKHRVVTVAAAAVTNYSLNFTGVMMQGPGFIGPGGPQLTLQPGDGVVFARGGPGTQMNANASVTLQIVFGQGLEVENRPVADTLRWFHHHIRDVVFQALEPHL